jgi:hypothetical protein
VLYELWTPGLLLLVVVILLFPDGQLSPGWRWLLRVYLVMYACFAVALAVATATALVAHPLAVDGNGGLAATDNATGWFGAIQSVTLIPALELWVAAAVRQGLAWRRSAGDVRQQLKWLALGAAATITGVVLTTAGFGVGWFGFAALPLSIGVGILRYRLYEIDRIISRTLAYAVVTGLLVGVYAGLVLLATRVLPLSGPVAVAGATLAAAALFSPLRRWVQAMVDRRFNRARYDADQMISGFAARLQDSTDLAGVQADLLGTVRQTLEPAHASVWLGGGQP